jgi:hypothetical protein
MPSGVKAYRENNRVRIGWNAALDANGNAVAGYNIYRASSPAGPYSKVNTGLVAGTEFVDTEGAVGIEESGETGGSYYAVSSVDSDGAESAQSLGVSPATIASAGGDAPGAAAAAACFVDTVGQPVTGVLVWLLSLLTIAVAVLTGIRHQASPLKSGISRLIKYSNVFNRHQVSGKKAWHIGCK